MVERGTNRISTTGLIVAVLAWNGFQLPWGSIIHEQMRIELCRKHSQNPVKLYFAVYLMLLTYRELKTQAVVEAGPSKPQVVVDLSSQGGSGEIIPNQGFHRLGKKPWLESPPKKRKKGLKPPLETQEVVEEDLMDLDKEEARFSVE